jgi:hypothetical protein
MRHARLEQGGALAVAGEDEEVAGAGGGDVDDDGVEAVGAEGWGVVVLDAD